VGTSLLNSSRYALPSTQLIAIIKCLSDAKQNMFFSQPRSSSRNRSAPRNSLIPFSIFLHTLFHILPGVASAKSFSSMFIFEVFNSTRQASRISGMMGSALLAVSMGILTSKISTNTLLKMIDLA